MLNRVAPIDPARYLESINLAGRERVVIAVSGGGDSLALLFLVHDFVQRIPNPPELFAVTVDHGLRCESAREADAVASLCSGHQIAHKTLRWDGRKPATGVSQAAREARHALLADAALAAGTDLVLTGHTLDDQAETVTMRASRDAAQGFARGMAGMAPATLFDGRVWFARPLLSARRTELRDYLRHAGVCWADDPTNSDLHYERARIRKGLDDRTLDEIVANADAAAVRREELGRHAAAIIKDDVKVETPGLFRLSRRIINRDRPAAIYALRILLAVTGGREQLADEPRTADLLKALGSERFRATLSRTVIDCGRDGIALYRETRNLPRVRLENGPIVWDGRFRISAARNDADLTIGPPGPENARAATTIRDQPAAKMARAAFAAQPAVWEGGRCLGLARELPGVDCTALAPPWARYMPSFDLAPAGAVARLLAVAKPLSPPLAGHNER